MTFTCYDLGNLTYCSLYIACCCFLSSPCTSVFLLLLDISPPCSLPDTSLSFSCCDFESISLKSVAHLKDKRFSHIRMFQLSHIKNGCTPWLDALHPLISILGRLSRDRSLPMSSPLLTLTSRRELRHFPLIIR